MERANLIASSWVWRILLGMVVIWKDISCKNGSVSGVTYPTSEGCCVLGVMDTCTSLTATGLRTAATTSHSASIRGGTEVGMVVRKLHLGFEFYMTTTTRSSRRTTTLSKLVVGALGAVLLTCSVAVHPLRLYIPTRTT